MIGTWVGKGNGGVRCQVSEVVGTGFCTDGCAWADAKGSELRDLEGFGLAILGVVAVSRCRVRV